MEKRELRKDIIEKKLSYIIDSVNLISENLPKDYGSFANLRLIKDGIYKRIEFALENIIDICNIINSDLSLGIPEEEDSILENLRKNNVLDGKIIDNIMQIKRFRNVLVHKYGDINDEQAFDSISNELDDFNSIIEAIQKILSND